MKETVIVVGSNPQVSEEQHRILVDYPKVESSQCILYLSKNESLIENLSDSSGTFLNYKRIEGKVPFTNEDVITFAKTVPFDQGLIEEKLLAIKNLAPKLVVDSNNDWKFFLRRTGAYWLDLIILVGIGYLMFRFHKELMFQFDLGRWQSLLTLHFVAVSFALYYLCFILPCSLYGFTLGKYVFKLRVKDALAGKNLNVWKCWKRAFAKVISLLAGIGFLRFWIREDRLTLHEYLTKTRVVVHED